jgi:hypothetical protein
MIHVHLFQFSFLVEGLTDLILRLAATVVHDRPFEDPQILSHKFQRSSVEITADAPLKFEGENRALSEREYNIFGDTHNWKSEMMFYS